MKSLYLFTAQYPYSSIENFLEDEIHYLATKFENIYIIPSTGKGEKRPVPSNCHVYNPLNNKGKLSLCIKGIFSFKSINIIINDFFKGKVYQSRNKLKTWILYSLRTIEPYQPQYQARNEGRLRPELGNFRLFDSNTP